MEPVSLGYRTDLFFPKFEGVVTDRGDYLVILTPKNPGFFWGNYLLFSAPPEPGDLDRWQALFRQEVSARQETHHIAFGWDSPAGTPGEVKPFLEAGYELIESVVLTTRQVCAPAKYNHLVEVRPLVEDWEWEQALLNQVHCRPPEHRYEEYLPFKTEKMAQYRRMRQAGLGEWFGAFLEGRLVADLGLFHEGAIGRFQSVETAPEFRRQGICGTLVYQAAKYGFEHMGVDTLVMVADENYHAARIYESVGFEPTERQVGLQFWKRE